jgi:hypothetical protein
VSGATAGTLAIGAAGGAAAEAAAGVEDGHVVVTVGADGVGVGVAEPLFAGGKPTVTGKVTVVSPAPTADWAYAAKSTPRPEKFGILTSTL